MQLVYLAIFLASLAFNLFALEVVIMDYSNINYETPTMYGPYPKNEKLEECFCYELD